MIYGNLSMAQDYGDPPAIAIIDDDDAVRSAIRLLAVSLGWTAHCYGAAGEFLDDLSTKPVDCLILDLQMPGVTGADLLEDLKSRGISLPVVVITALKDDPMVARAHASGAMTVLTKPFRDQALVTAIEQVLGRPVN